MLRLLLQASTSVDIHPLASTASLGCFHQHEVSPVLFYRLQSRLFSTQTFLRQGAESEKSSSDSSDSSSDSDNETEQLIEDEPYVASAAEKQFEAEEEQSHFYHRNTSKHSNLHLSVRSVFDILESGVHEDNQGTLEQALSEVVRTVKELTPVDIGYLLDNLRGVGCADKRVFRQCKYRFIEEIHHADLDDIGRFLNATEGDNTVFRDPDFLIPLGSRMGALQRQHNYQGQDLSHSAFQNMAPPNRLHQSQE